MITAVEKGRKLIITVGAGGDDAIEIAVPPVNTAVGSAIFALWAGITFAQVGDKDDTREERIAKVEVNAENMAKLAIGEDNWPVVEDLRSAESTAVINAAIFWNVQGGGIELVNEMLRDGYPKARMTLATSNGLGDVLSRLQTLLDGVLANQTRSPDGTRDTRTPVGTGGSFGPRRKDQPATPLSGH